MARDIKDNEYNPKAIKCHRTGEHTGRVDMDDCGYADFKFNYWPDNLKDGGPPPHKSKALVVPKDLKINRRKPKPGKTTYVMRNGKLVEA